jgi:hypothetical protein
MVVCGVIGGADTWVVTDHATDGNCDDVKKRMRFHAIDRRIPSETGSVSFPQEIA